MEVMKRTLVLMLATIMLLPGCSKNVEKDCTAAIPAINVAFLRVPASEKEREEDVRFLEKTVAEWEQVSRGLQTPEVRERGSAIAAQLTARKALLDAARVETKKQPSAAPPANSADPREAALGEAAAAGMAGLLGGGTLPPETVAQLRTNGEAVEKLRLDLIDWCQENE